MVCQLIAGYFIPKSDSFEKLLTLNFKFRGDIALVPFSTSLSKWIKSLSIHLIQLWILNKKSIFEMLAFNLFSNTDLWLSLQICSYLCHMTIQTFFPRIIAHFISRFEVRFLIPNSLFWGFGYELIIYNSLCSKTSSSCRAIGTDIPDPFLPQLPIVHRFRQVLRATPRILAELLYVGSS